MQSSRYVIPMHLNCCILVIGSGSIKADRAKVACITDWPNPRNVHELRSFLGNYFRKFVMAYSIRVAPLTKLTGQKIKWDWTDQCQRALEGLKQDMTLAPVLASLDMTKHLRWSLHVALALGLCHYRTSGPSPLSPES